MPEYDIDDSEMDSEAESEEHLPFHKDAVYNREGLVEKLGDIAWPVDLDWIHKLTVLYDQTEEIDVNDDLSRELSFYNQALAGTRNAFENLQSMGIPFLRPPNFYAEMVKSDNHMMKIKGRLLTQKRKIEESEERRKARDSKKMAKEVQAEKVKEKAKHKKEEFESVKKWRKQRQKSGFENKKENDMQFGDERNPFQRSKKKRPGVSPSDRSGGFKLRGSKNKDRAFREKKFGHGGRKSLKKQNSAETTNDLRGFNNGGTRGGKKSKRF